MQTEISSAQTSALMPKGTANQQVLTNFKILLAAVSTVSKVSANQILGDNREPRIARARRVVAYLASTALEASKTKVSKFMDLDPTSVSYMIKKVTQELDNCDIVTTDLLMDSITEYKNTNVGKVTMSRNKHDKSMVLLGMYDDGMLITIDGESIFHEMNSQQMIGLAIELLERAQLSANLPQKESDYQ
jgi:hypothetical protein